MLSTKLNEMKLTSRTPISHERSITAHLDKISNIDFNYILYVLHTGCQWYKLPIEKTREGKPEISYTRLFKHFRTWERNGCFCLMLQATVALLSENNLLDLSVLHGDGSTTAAKKGATI